MSKRFKTNNTGFKNSNYNKLLIIKAKTMYVRRRYPYPMV